MRVDFTYLARYFVREEKKKTTENAESTEKESVAYVTDRTNRIARFYKIKATFLNIRHEVAGQ